MLFFMIVEIVVEISDQVIHVSLSLFVLCVGVLVWHIVGVIFAAILSMPVSDAPVLFVGGKWSVASGNH